MRCVCMHITSKQIELESLGFSGFVANSKPDQLGLSSYTCAFFGSVLFFAVATKIRDKYAVSPKIIPISFPELEKT